MNFFAFLLIIFLLQLCVFKYLTLCSVDLVFRMIYSFMGNQNASRCWPRVSATTAKEASQGAEGTTQVGLVGSGFQAGYPELAAYPPQRPFLFLSHMNEEFYMDNTVNKAKIYYRSLLLQDGGFKKGKTRKSG